MDPGALARTELLQGLNAAALGIIASRGIVRPAQADETLWLAGAEPQGLAIVLSGEVRVVQSSRGRLRVLHTEGAGGTLGEVPLFGGGRYPASAIASRSASLLIVPKAVLFDAIRADPALAFRLLERVARRLRHVLERFEHAQSQNVTGRLAQYLLTRYAAAGANPVSLGATQQNVAEEIGTVREVVVRALRELRERGLVTPSGRGRYCLDVAGLERYLTEATDV